MTAGVVLGMVLDQGHAWVTPDSVTYLGVAHNLVHGQGVTSPFRNTLDPFSPVPSAAVPLVHWPPGYPALLAVFATVGLSPLTVAQVLNLVCLALVIGLGAAIAWARTRRPVPTVVLAALMLASTTVLQLGRFALSDLTFFALCACFLYSALRVLQGRPHLLWVMAAIATAAGLVRWAGISLVVPSVVVCLLDDRRRGALGVAALQLGVTLLWQLVLIAEAQPTRDFVWHPPVELHALARATGSLFSPETTSASWSLVLGVVIVVAVVLMATRVVWERSDPFRLTLVSFLCSYSVVLVVSRLVFDADIPWDGRILAPIYLGVLVLVFDLACDAPAAGGWVCAALLGAIVLGQLWSWPSLVSQSASPQGYTSSYWQHLPLARISVRLSSYSVVASNFPDVVYFRLHRSAVLTLPQVVSPTTLLANRRAAVDLQELGRTLRQHGAFVDFVDPTNPRSYLASESSAARAFGMHVVATFPGAVIYAH